MRPLMAVAVWIVLIGGIYLFTTARTAPQASDAKEYDQAAGSYSLEIMTTFPLEPDPFAVTTEAGKPAPALSLKLNGKEILSVTDQAQRETILSVEDPDGLVQGRNEFFIEAAPPTDGSASANAVHITVYRGHVIVAEESIWARPGLKISGTVNLTIQPDTPTEEHDHGR